MPYVDNFNIADNIIDIHDTGARNAIKALPGLIYSPAEKGKNILFFGDSWTTGVGADSPATEKFSTVLAASLDMTEVNYGVGASGFARPLTIEEQVDNAIENMSAADKEDTRIIMIVAGVNDLRNIATETIANVTAAINTVVTKCKAAYPSAVICFAVNMVPTTVGTAMRNWIDMIHDYCRMITGAPVLVFDDFPYQFIGRPDLYKSDLLHPTTAGHQLIAGLLRNWLLGGTSAHLSKYIDQIPLTRENYAIAGSGGQIFVENGKVHINECQITCPAESGHLNIGQLPAGCIPINNIYFPLFSGATGMIGYGAITASGAIYTNQYVSQVTNFRMPALDYWVAY